MKECHRAEHLCEGGRFERYEEKSPNAMPSMQRGTSLIRSAQAMLRRSRPRMVTAPQRLSTVQAGTR